MKQEPVCPIAPAPHRPNPPAWPDDRLTVSWLGHAGSERRRVVLTEVGATWSLLGD